MKNYLFIVLIGSIILCSCTSQIESRETTPSERVNPHHLRSGDDIEEPTVTLVDGEKTLVFKSLEHLVEWSTPLIAFSDSEKVLFVEKYGVKSYLSQYCDYRQQIVKLGTEPYSDQELETTIKDIADNSAFYMLFEDSRTLLHPIIRAKSLTEAFVANKNGNYVVDGKVKTVELFQDYREYINSSLTSVVTTEEPSGNSLLRNAGFAENGNYKVWFELRLDMLNKVVFYRGESQKRVNVMSLFSYWTVYRGNIFSKLRVISNKKFYATGKKEYVREIFPNYPLLNQIQDNFYLEEIEGNPNSKKNPPFTISADNESVIYFNDWGPDFTGVLGYFNKPTDPDDPDFSKKNIMTGDLFVWSEELGTNNISRVDVNIEM